MLRKDLPVQDDAEQTLGNLRATSSNSDRINSKYHLHKTTVQLKQALQQLDLAIAAPNQQHMVQRTLHLIGEIRKEIQALE